MSNTTKVKLPVDFTPTIIEKLGDVFYIESEYQEEDVLYSFNLNADNDAWHRLKAKEIVQLPASVQLKLVSIHQVGHLVVSNF